MNAANKGSIDFDIRFFTYIINDPVDKEVNEQGQDRKQGKAGDKQTYNGWNGSPGPDLSACRWFHRNDVAAVATDTLVFEVYPSQDVMLAVHMIDIVDMGLTQGQNFDLDGLATDCAADGRYTFFLEASPQPFVGGCGSPVNPVAVK